MELKKILQYELRAEKAFRLPVGTLEAIRHNPSPHRTAEVIAAVRDVATGDRPMTAVEGYHVGAPYETNAYVNAGTTAQAHRNLGTPVRDAS